MLEYLNENYCLDLSGLTESNNVFTLSNCLRAF